MQVDAVPDPSLYPFRSRWFDSTAGRMHYIDEGAGPPILFCHGSPTWSFLYRHLVRELRGRYRCIAVDMPGFGLSERPDGFGYTIAEQIPVMGEFVDHLGLDGFIVMGHDWGGPVGLGAAVERADRVAGIVLGNTVFWPVDPIVNRMFSAIMGSGPMCRRILERNLLVEKLVIGTLGGVLSEAEAEQYRAVQPNAEARVALAVMPGEIRAARDVLARLADEVPERLGRVRTLAVWGMRDKVFRPADCLPRLRTAFDDLTIVEVPHVGHFIPEEAPEEIVAAIESRFSRV